MDKKLSGVGNLSTQIKSSQALIKDYNALSKKIVKTEAEQKKLNDTVRQLGDIHSIDVIEDEYGNLLIDINEVNKKLETLKENQLDALETLRKQEIDSIADATGGFFNSNTVEDAVDKIFATSKSKYRDLLNDFDDGLDKTTRNLADSTAKVLQSNIKNSLIKDLEENVSYYSTRKEGMAGSLLNNQETFNQLKSSDWNSLYSEIDFLKNNLSDMSYEEVQQHMDTFYANWSGNNIIIGEQWEILKDSINNTVFDNKSLTEFFSKIATLEAKSNHSFYNKKIDELNKNIDELQQEVNMEDLDAALMGGTGALVGTAIAPGVGTLIGGGIGLIVGGLKSWFSEENKQLQAAKEWKEKLEKERDEFYEDIAKSQNFVTYDEEEEEYKYDTAAAEKWTQAQIKLGEALEKTKLSTQSFLTSLQDFSNYEGLSADEAEAYTAMMSDIMNGLDSVELDGEKVNFIAKYYREHEHEMSDKIKEQYKKIIDEAMNNLPITSTKTFTQLGEELDTISKDLRDMNKIVEEFKENGALTLDTYMDLANVLDKMDITALGSMEGGEQYIDNMIAALDNLNLAYDANNGMITMNGDALKDLQSIQEAQAKAKIAATIQDLKASKAVTEAELAMIDGQIAGAQAAIKAVEAMSEGQVINSEITNAANEATTESTIQGLQAVNKGYRTDAENNNVWKAAIINNLADATKAWNEYYKAIRDGSGNVEDLYNIAMQKSRTNFAGFDSNSGID